MFAPALAGVLIGVAWFGVGGVFIASGVASAVAAVFVARLPRVPRRTDFSRSPFGEILDAVRYVRANHEVGLIALVTVGVVMIGFPYLTFLPTLADDRFDVGALGYGVMSGVAGLGAVDRRARHRRPQQRPAPVGHDRVVGGRLRRRADRARRRRLLPARAPGAGVSSGRADSCSRPRRRRCCCASRRWSTTAACRAW